MTFAIKAEGLGKRYLIGHQRKEAYGTLRDSFVHVSKRLLNRFLHPNLASSGSEIEEFWALKDVSFEIKPGDRVGIIGRNGAGKSTLLKILSRITEPTTGRFTTRGRVASLLEVGTGFHPELSGRENIFLNGAILGMSKADVQSQFDAIVDFSGIEKFLDTPVKRYSSGMYVRLAFAVAAHLDPDILIVDEVLAVGDAEFQKKCLGKMEDAGKQGRTVVFVSHNMGAVRRLCDRGIILNDGQIVCNEQIVSAIEHYLGLSDNGLINVHKKSVARGAQIKSIDVRSKEGDSLIKSNDHLLITVTFDKNLQPYNTFQLVLGFYEQNEQALFRLDTGVISLAQNQDIQDILKIETSSVNLIGIQCLINVALFIDGELSDHQPKFSSFQIINNPPNECKELNRELAVVYISSNLIPNDSTNAR